MNQKRFINIAIVVGVIVTAGIVWYFVLNKQTLPSAKPISILTTSNQIPTSTPSTQQPPIISTQQEPTILPNNFKYPYTLKSLPQDKISILRSEFIVSNTNICAQINEYGLTDRKDQYGKYGCNNEATRAEIIDEMSITELVKNWLVQNSKFTGVTKKSDAVVRDVVKIYGCIKCDTLNSDRKVIGLKIYFHKQTHNGLPIEGDFNPLSVFADAKGVSSVDGHFFPNITVPTEPKISEDSAKNNLIGRIFTYSDMAGDPRSHRVGGEKLTVIAKVVFVKKSSQGLEFRLAWKIFVGQNLPWTVYVDAVTGEELKVVQMFNT